MLGGNFAHILNKYELERLLHRTLQSLTDISNYVKIIIITDVQVCRCHNIVARLVLFMEIAVLIHKKTLN